MPQSLTNSILIKSHCGIANDNAVARIAGFIPRGRKLLIDLIGEDLYQDLLGRDEDDPDRQNASRAESYAAVFSSMIFLNLRPTDLGGFSKIIGYGDRQEELMGVAELEKYRSLIYNQVVDLIAELVEQPEDMVTAGGFGIMAIGGAQ